MEGDSDPTWFSVEWMQELRPLSTAYGPITYGDLAKLMAMFPEVEDIQRHVGDVVAGTRTPIPSDLPPAVAEALAQVAELNEWAILSVSYPQLPADVLAGRPLQRKLICRSFSDCTSAPRNGMISGCFPLDNFYKALPEHKQLIALKHGLSESPPRT